MKYKADRQNTYVAVICEEVPENRFPHNVNNMTRAVSKSYLELVPARKYAAASQFDVHITLEIEKLGIEKL